MVKSLDARTWRAVVSRLGHQFQNVAGTPTTVDLNDMRTCQQVALCLPCPIRINNLR